MYCLYRLESLYECLELVPGLVGNTARTDCILERSIDSEVCISHVTDNGRVGLATDNCVLPLLSGQSGHVVR